MIIIQMKPDIATNLHARIRCVVIIDFIAGNTTVLSGDATVIQSV
jgi:hypothetical protein